MKDKYYIHTGKGNIENALSVYERTGEGYDVTRDCRICGTRTHSEADRICRLLNRENNGRSNKAVVSDCVDRLNTVLTAPLFDLSLGEVFTEVDRVRASLKELLA